MKRGSPRWRAFAAGVCVEAVGGLQYMFGVYSQTIKDHYSLSQQQLTTIATVGNMGGNIGVHAGLFYNLIGPRGTLLVATIMGGCSWTLLWACLNFDWSVPLGVLCAISFFQGHAQLWADLAVIPTGGTNFPKQRGGVIGILKAFVGLSGAIVTQVYVAVFKPADGVVNFLLFLACVFAVVTLLANPFVTIEPSEHQHPSKLNSATCIVLAVAGVLAAAGILDTVMDPLPRGYSIAAMLLVVLLIAGLALMLGSTRDLELPDHHQAPLHHHQAPLHPEETTEPAEDEAHRRSQVSQQRNGARPQQLNGLGHLPPLEHSRLSARDTLHTAGSQDTRGSWMARETVDSLPRDTVDTQSSYFQWHKEGEPDEQAEEQAAEPEEGMDLWEALRCTDFWLHFTTIWTGCGAGLLLINNVSQIQIAFGGTRSGGDVFVTILSVCSGLGRVLVGLISDKYPRRRPFFMSLSLGTIALSMGMLTMNSKGALWISCVLGGLAFGAVNCMNATMVSEIFGLKHFGAIYGASSVALAVGSVLVASVLVGQVYDPLKPDDAAAVCNARHDATSCHLGTNFTHGRCFFDKDATGSSKQAACSWSCTGSDCFTNAFLVAGGVALLGTLCSLTVAFRTRERYSKLYATDT